jgi:hypothetical protein
MTVNREKLEGQLKEWAAGIDALKGRADRGRADLKMKYYGEIEELRKKQESAQMKLGEIKESSAEAWNEIKVGVEKSLKDVKGAVDRAASKFKKAA